MTDPMVWTYNGHSVFFDPQTGMGSLTTMWEACGRPDGQNPAQWMRLPQAEQVMEALARMLNVEKSHIYDSRRGRDGGTWAHWQIATVYAHYLSPHFYLWWNEQARAHIEGRATPAEFGVYLSQLMKNCDEAETEIKHVRELARQLGEAVHRLPYKLEAMRVMIPAVDSRQIADPTTIGYVYVFRVKGTNQCKIGKTRRDVETRKKELSGPINTQLEDIAVITTDDPDLLEKRLHGFYKRKKVTGAQELFNLSKQDIERIQGLDDFVTAGLFDPDVLTVYEQQALIA